MKIISKKRRRENKTNYLKRRKLLKSKKLRIVIRKTNRYIIIQYVESKVAQDKVKYTLTSRELLKYGWPKEKSNSLKSLGAAYITGILFGKTLVKGEEAKKEAVLDTGLIKSTKGSRIYAALKGLVDSGYNIKYDPEMFPDEKRIVSEKIKDFFEAVKSKILVENK